jgi:hypothetical protein
MDDHDEITDALERRIARLRRLCARDTRTAARLAPRLRQLEREAADRLAPTDSEPVDVLAHADDARSLTDELAARRRAARLTARA